MIGRQVRRIVALALVWILAAFVGGLGSLPVSRAAAATHTDLVAAFGHVYDGSSAFTTLPANWRFDAQRVARGPRTASRSRTAASAPRLAAKEGGRLRNLGRQLADERGSVGGYPGELGGAIARGGRFNDPVTAFKQLEDRYGIEPRVLSERFHRIKPGAGAGARDDTLIDLTGNVYDTTTGERLGQIIVRQGG